MVLHDVHVQVELTPPFVDTVSLCFKGVATDKKYDHRIRDGFTGHLSLIRGALQPTGL